MIIILVIRHKSEEKKRENLCEVSPRTVSVVLQSLRDGSGTDGLGYPEIETGSSRLDVQLRLCH